MLVCKLMPSPPRPLVGFITHQSGQALAPAKLKCPWFRHRNTWQLPTWADGDTCLPCTGSSLDGEGLARCGPQTESAQEFYQTIALLLSPILTKAIESLRYSKVGHFYLWSRQDPFLVVANGNIHHPVIMALMQNRILTRTSRKSFCKKNENKNNRKVKNPMLVTFKSN